ARKKHAEFVAVDRSTGSRVLVEAKSRHRQGVKGSQSGHSIPPGNRVGVRDLLVGKSGAYGKNPELPFYVFVDVNLPPFDSTDQRQLWNTEIEQLMADLKAEGYEDPCPANAVFFVNDPSHYKLESPIDGPNDCLWIRQFHP